MARSTSYSPSFLRPQAALLARRLSEKRRFIQVVAGPRQVGKTTLVQQVVGRSGIAAHFASADEPTLRGALWIEQQWDIARVLAGGANRRGAVLVLDEIQKLTGWSETVKRLWDEDTRHGVNLRVIVLGSAPLLIARGLAESLAGRFEVLHLRHWSYAEMQAAFGWSLDRFLFHGGYPGAAALVADPARWRRYILDSLIETSVSRDVLLLSRVDKPALLRRLFELACRYSGQVLSFNKMLGQLQDAGNATTLAHYLELLAAAGMVTGVPKYAGDVARQRGSSPKLQVFDTALLTAQSGLTPSAARRDGQFFGRLVESAIGAHLASATACGDLELFYWRERNFEVDFVTRVAGRVTAIEVKSSRTPDALPGMAAFDIAFAPDRRLLIGSGGIAVEDFLAKPALHWLAH